MPESYSRTFRFGPIERRGLVGALRVGQVLLLGLGCCLAVIAVRAFATGLGLALAVLTLLTASVLAFMPMRGRTAEQWLPVLAGWLLGRRRGLHSFRSTGPTAGHVARLDGSHGRQLLDLPASLAGCEILCVPVAGGQEVGVFRDPALGALTGVLAVRVRAFGLLGEREQERRLERWGRLMGGRSRGPGGATDIRARAHGAVGRRRAAALPGRGERHGAADQ